MSISIGKIFNNTHKRETVLIENFFTGKLDSQTIEAMSLPRCGVKDKVGTGDNRAKRYALQGTIFYHNPFLVNKNFDISCRQ